MVEHDDLTIRNFIGLKKGDFRDNATALKLVLSELFLSQNETFLCPYLCCL